LSGRNEMREELRRMALFSSGVAELTRNRAEEIVRDFVKAGDVRRKQASSMVKTLMETSRANRRELVRFVRSEIRAQVESLGLATKRDVERLERRVVRLEGGGKKTGSRKTAGRRAGKKSTGRGTTRSRKQSARRTASTE
jgi:polyhydroxyalkanoate synthesis regulator phasin